LLGLSCWLCAKNASACTKGFLQNDLVPVMAFHFSMVLELVYFYLPPKDAGLPYLITQVTVTFLSDCHLPCFQID